MIKGFSKEVYDGCPSSLRLKYSVSKLASNFSDWPKERSKPMQIIAKCPRCGSTWSLNGSAADCRTRCGKCGLLFKIPKLNELPKAMKVIKHAKKTLYVDEDGKSYG